MSDVSQSFVFMPEDKRRLLAQLLKTEGVKIATSQTLAARERRGALPLSFGQLRLYFLDQLTPGQATYNNANAFYLNGPIDEEILQRCLNEIVKRHEALRTTFLLNEEVGETPEQVIAPAAVVPLLTRDLCLLDGSEREREALRLANLEAQAPFDLAQGPLLRVTLLKLETCAHLLLITTHHIISDGFSLHIFLRELSTLYEAFIANRPSPLAALPVQYPDFAIWQREWLSIEVRQKLLNYWGDQLRDMPPLLQFPADHPRPLFQTYQGRSQTFSIHKELAARLRLFSRQENVTLFMTLLAAFQLLLYRYTGQSDIVVGSPIANRTFDNISNLIGFFANIVILRTKVEKFLAFRELLASVREMTLDAYAHQEMPFEQLVEELMPTRNLSYNPLFQVVFALQESPLSSFHLPGVQISSWETETGTSKFDLALLLEESAEEISGKFEYSTALFEESSIKRLGEHLNILLEHIIREPDRSLVDFSLLSESEKRFLLTEANMTRTDFPLHATIYEIFARQVSQTPEAIAVEFQDQRLTYLQLGERANQLAHHLRERGVGPETRVGIYLDRSPMLLIALLAILQTGGAYVPLDPSYPLERMRFVFQDADIFLLLTSESYLAHLEQLSLPPLMCLDRERELEQTEPDSPLSVPVMADNLAYIMYTSGSTGLPKGVEITHRSVVHLVKENIYARLNAEESILHLAPLAFDASTFEIWGALLNGGRLVLLPTQTPSLEEIAFTLEQRAITTLWLTAGLFHQMVETHLNSLRGLKQLLAGGDVLSPIAVEKVLRLASGVHMINGYGPTECTTFSTWFAIEDKARISEITPTVPIGRPLGNVRIYILDERLQPVPAGVTGELYIAGPGLARGYLGLPGLTAERFLPDPFYEQPGARMYKTGDLVRYRSDGNIEFLGRSDRQVKLRGFRIEPGEIEAVLARYPGIRHVAVVPQNEAGQADKRLLAYLVPSDPASLPSMTELRAYARQKLPAYMVPAAFIWLDSFPLTPNGKLEIAALPLPEQRSLDRDSQDLGPRSTLEAQLAEIWAEVLGLDFVGREENFFDLGGHSLMATRVLSRMHKKLSIELPMRFLFEFPTVAGLAQIIREQQQGDPSELLQAPVGAQEAEMLLARIAELSDADIAALIQNMSENDAGT